MRLVTLECRECGESPSFASEYEPHEQTKIEDMQLHMDINFKARCNKCFACNWEVTDVRKVDKVLHVAYPN